MNKNIVLVGNANVGKTTIFNALAKQNQKTGNWHGVTNSVAKAEFKIGQNTFSLYDIPGIYSLSALSFEEKVATEFVLNNTDFLFLNICEQQNLNRNLYLTLQLLELGVQTILIVNTKGKPCNINLKKISNQLGVIVEKYENKKDIFNLKKIIQNYKPLKIKQPEYINQLLNKYNFDLIQEKKTNICAIKKNKKSNKKNKDNILNCENCNKNCYFNNNQFNIDKINENFIKIKLLENDEFFCELFKKPPEKIEQIAYERYNFINSILQKSTNTKNYGTSKLDKILLNKFFALPIFFILIFAIFYLTFFSLGAYIRDLITSLMGSFGSGLINFLGMYLKDGWFLDLIDSAVIGSVGSLLSFLPQICLLFLFLTILEDSGYLSRVAFLFEDILCKLGLSGKGVYTLLMGFGCSATSIMTARNMEDKNAKIKVALITPFFSCSAKLPIFAVLGGAFFKANIFVIFGLYLLGVIIGLISCCILNKLFFKSKEQSFILEFAPMQSVSFKRITKVTRDNIKQFLLRIGSVIVCLNVIMFILSSFSFKFEYTKLTNSQSMLECIGTILAPIFIPLGFGNWGSVSALLSGLIAKETVVSSIAIFNNVTSNSASLQASLYNPASAVSFTQLSAISFLIFCLLYTPCITTLAVIKKELGTRYALISFAYQFLIAYIFSFLSYSILTFNWLNILILLTTFALVTALIVACKFLKRQKLRFST